MSDITHQTGDVAGEGEPTRRDFIHIATGAFAAAGAGLFGWSLIDSMNPAGDTLAASSADVDVGALLEGSEIRILIGGKPVFVRHRTQGEIDAARAVDVDRLKDPQTDEERLRPATDGNLKPQYLVMFGSCTHLGCVPVGDGAGDYGGWYCPCHASHYDTSGRVRKGPAPLNLPIPDYEYTTDSTIKISL